MKPIATLKVRPYLPEPLKPLLSIAYNLRWSWDHAAIDLFRRFDRQLWEDAGRNPVRLLGMIDQSLLDKAANDESFMAHMNGVKEHLEHYLSGKGAWYHREHSEADGMLVAYFSAEFGVTESVPIFAGGLGVLAGDHLKASSDLGLPLVGVGLLYQQGYFRQYLNAAGWQQEAFEENDFHTLPIELVPGVKIGIQMPEGEVKAQVWRALVGRIQLFLLDANIPENLPEQRKITAQLYGGDLEMRIRQEILLGIGGMRALDAMGIKPTVYHMNEGHSAFLAVERVARLMETENLSAEEAVILASSGMVFTTHTPVPAGHDYFPPNLIEKYFSRAWRRLGIDRSTFLGMGRKNPADDREDFCMTVLALRLAAFSNGVSKLHGGVSRKMWSGLWPSVPQNEIPIGHVTNGVHFRSWVSLEMNQLYDRYLGPKWREEPADKKLWKGMHSIPAAELWRTHERRRERLVAFARLRLQEQLTKRGAPQSEIDQAEEVLSADALTIGFGRRFATYKRATLLLRDPERLSKLLNDPHRPVQIIYAGKAHPHDQYGKELIQTIIDLAKRPEFRRHIVFLENYDMATARYMVQGCDVWLNTPLRPQEASGTSGMKALANGALNVSTLDGWWDEAWEAGQEHTCQVGWAIGKGETYQDSAYQDRVEAEALYGLLENDIVPTFYERRADGIPRRWVDLMKSSMELLCPQFCMHRMVMQYADEYYLATHRRFCNLHRENAVRARNLAAWKRRVESSWPRVQVRAVPLSSAEVELGREVSIAAEVSLDALAPEDVSVQLVTGRVDVQGELQDRVLFPMDCEGRQPSGAYLFRTAWSPSKSGLCGYAIRVLPKNADAVGPLWPPLIAWAGEIPVTAPEPVHT